MTLLSRVCVSPYWYFIETMSVCRTVYKIFSVKEWRNLETGGRGRSRSLKMAPFNRSYTTFYWSAIVSIAVLYHFQVIWRWIIVTLKRSLKVIRTSTIRKLGCDFLCAFHSNYCRIFNRHSASKNSVTLKTGLEVVHSYWKRRRSIDHIRLTIGPPL